MSGKGSASITLAWFAISPARWIDTHSGEDVENDGSIFTLKSCGGLPIHRVIEDRSEEYGVLLGLWVELSQTSPFKDDEGCL